MISKINSIRVRKSGKTTSYNLFLGIFLMNLKIKQYWIALILLSISFGLNAQDKTGSERSIEELIGKWTIDLRPTPDSNAYYQAFNVDSITENTFIGTFYGSKIEDALINRNWDKLYFAFSTSDQTNTYFHSGYIEKGKVFGITYCPDREFTAPWTGIKN